MDFTQDMLNTMAQRRAAGERVSALAGELGIPWQRLEKITRRVECQPISSDPAVLKRELRWTRLMLSAVPSLGCDKPWAIAWRNRICRRLRRRMAQLRRRLSEVLPPTQVPEKKQRMWRPRPASPIDARIARQYDPKATAGLWGDV